MMRQNPRTKQGKRQNAVEEVAVEDVAGADEGVEADVDEVEAEAEVEDFKIFKRSSKAEWEKWVSILHSNSYYNCCGASFWVIHMDREKLRVGKPRTLQTLKIDAP